jgi:hypothetical protein
VEIVGKWCGNVVRGRKLRKFSLDIRLQWDYVSMLGFRKTEDSV